MRVIGVFSGGIFVDFGSAVNLPITVTAVVAWLSSLIYVAVRFRRGRRRFSIVNAIVMVLLMATVSAGAMPLVVAAVYRTKDTAVLANPQCVRSQIAQYKLEHNGEPPILYQGTLPQLLQATNAEGMPGPPGKDRPYGPYLQQEFSHEPGDRADNRHAHESLSAHGRQRQRGLALPPQTPGRSPLICRTC